MGPLGVLFAKHQTFLDDAVQVSLIRKHRSPHPEARHEQPSWTTHRSGPGWTWRSHETNSKSLPLGTKGPSM